MRLTAEESLELARLLDRVAEDVRQGVPYPIPDAAYESLHRVVPYPAIDTVILSPDDDGRFLMVWRGDKYFRGWELVGGYGHWPESPATWHNRLAMRDIGATVMFIGITHIHKWMPGEHPHGAPISIVTLSRLTSPPTKGITKFFEKLPADVVPNHGRFVEISIGAMKSGKYIDFSPH